MSAIAGIVHFDGSAVSRADLERMAAALRPFGRDGERIVLDGDAGFVVRYNHFTPEDLLDRQPLLGEGSALVFDGRLDNRADLIAALGLGEGGGGLSDAALAARACEHWGDDAPDRMIGAFVLARWDAAARRLRFATSAPRGRQLYVYRAGPLLAFASAPHALFALPQVPRALDEAALADVLLKNTGDGETLYRDITVVPSAHFVDHDADGETRTRYWAPDRSRRAPYKREEEAWAALRPLFEEVVRSHLRAIAPVGIQMSGGLDSAMLAGQAARILRERGETLRGYTRVPAPGTKLRAVGSFYNDERPRVGEIVAKHPNIAPTFVHAGETSVMDDLNARFARTYGAGGAGLTFTTGYDALRRRAVEDGVRVLLTGASGNSSITYDGHARLGGLLRSGRLVALYRELYGLARVTGSAGKYIKAELYDALVPAKWREAFVRRKHRGDAPWDHYSAIDAGFAVDSGAAGRARLRDNIKLHWAGLDSWSRRASMFGRTAIGSGAEAILGLYGIELRDPFADRRIVEFCLALPDRFFLHKGIERRIARLGFPDLVPEAIARDPSRGRQDVDWVQRLERDRAEIERTLATLADDPEVARYLDVPRMRRLWAGFGAKDWQRAPLGDQIGILQGLMGGIEAGRFVRWFQGKN